MATEEPQGPSLEDMIMMVVATCKHCIAELAAGDKTAEEVAAQAATEIYPFAVQGGAPPAWMPMSPPAE